MFKSTCLETIKNYFVSSNWFHLKFLFSFELLYIYLNYALSQVWFQKLRSADGSMIHQGDEREGDEERDDESINVLCGHSILFFFITCLSVKLLEIANKETKNFVFCTLLFLSIKRTVIDCICYLV